KLIGGRAVSCCACPFAGLFHLLETRTQTHRYSSTAEFQGLDRSIALDEREKQYAKHLVILVFFLGGLGHVRGKWSDEAVAEENAEEGAYQRSSDFVPDLFGRATQRAHRDHNTENGSNDAESG